MLVSESSAMHQLRRRSAHKPQLDLIADRRVLMAPVIAQMSPASQGEGQLLKHPLRSRMSLLPTSF